MINISDDELLAQLGVEVEEKQIRLYTAEEERVIAGFEDITRFFDEQGHVPQHGDDKDIFERLYAVRLDLLRDSENWCAFLKPFDSHHLLDETAHPHIETMTLDDDALLSELGVETSSENSIENLKYVRAHTEKAQPEDIAKRKEAKDFAIFKPLFDAVQQDLKNGVRKTRPFVKNTGFSKAEIRQGQFFIFDGLIAYVANVGEPIKAPNGDIDARLRVIFSNKTESDLLLRSLQRALYKAEDGMRISELKAEAGPLFQDRANAEPFLDSEAEDDDLASGTIYILQSQSQDPNIVMHRNMIHKIGVTGGDVKKRIANAKNDPTYLMDDVEVVATYQLYNIKRTKFEKLLHKVFFKAQFDMVVKDRFGQSIHPKEWFLVPLPIIDEVIEKIKDDSILNYQYEPSEGRLILV